MENTNEIIKTPREYYEEGAGLYFAEDATEEAKAASDYITVSNQEDAIAKIIEDIEHERIIFPE